MLCKVEEWNGALAKWRDETKGPESEGEADARSVASGAVAGKALAFCGTDD